MSRSQQAHAEQGSTATGIVCKVENNGVSLKIDECVAFIPKSEQIEGELYHLGQRTSVFLLEKQDKPEGTMFVASRTHKDLLAHLLELEVPEIQQGIVSIKAIAREPGQRSKVAVESNRDGVDAVACCVGLRGSHIQRVVKELAGERIDIVLWSANLAVFVANALSPAQSTSVTVNEIDNTAEVVVPDKQLSLAIGKDGQNARLAAKLTGLRVDIKPASVTEVLQQAMTFGKPSEEVPAPLAEKPQG
jgi:N utilization substance protein A